MERNEKTYVRTKGLGGDRKTEIEDRKYKAEDTKTKEGHHFIYEGSSVTQIYSNSGTAPIFNFRFTISDVCRFYIQQHTHSPIEHLPFEYC